MNADASCFIALSKECIQPLVLALSYVYINYFEEIPGDMIDLVFNCLHMHGIPNFKICFDQIFAIKLLLEAVFLKQCYSICKLMFISCLKRAAS